MQEDATTGPRTPTSVIVVDANIILSVVLGRRSRPVFAEVIAARNILTSARAAEEVRHVLRSVPHLPPEAAELAEALLGGIVVVPQVVYAERLDEASHVLTDAVASRNGSVSDAHLLACAWTFDADVWSHDRDFAGTGWPAWSNANLYRAIGAEPKRGPPEASLTSL
jgi:predicted nucleic acid-binding protein